MWAAEQRYLVLGTPFRVAVEEAGLGERVAALLKPFQTKVAAHPRDSFQLTVTERGVRLYRDCQQRVSGATRDHVLSALVAEINRSAVEGCARLAIHASVVSFGDRLVAFPAESGGGKTTLAAASLLSGARYWSDEALVIDDDGSVVPYPKPLALSGWSCAQLGLERAGGERLITASELGAETAEKPLPLTDVVLASFGAPDTRLEPLPASRAVTALLSHAFNHYRNPDKAFALVTQVAARAHVWSLRYNSPATAARLLRSSVTKRASSSSPGERR